MSANDYECPRCHNIFPKKNKFLHDFRCTEERPLPLNQSNISFYNQNRRRNNRNIRYDNQNDNNYKTLHRPQPTLGLRNQAISHVSFFHNINDTKMETSQNYKCWICERIIPDEEISSHLRSHRMENKKNEEYNKTEINISNSNQWQRRRNPRPRESSSSSNDNDSLRTENENNNIFRRSNRIQRPNHERPLSYIGNMRGQENNNSGEETRSSVQLNIESSRSRNNNPRREEHKENSESRNNNYNPINSNDGREQGNNENDLLQQLIQLKQNINQILNNNNYQSQNHSNNQIGYNNNDNNLGQNNNQNLNGINNQIDQLNNRNIQGQNNQNSNGNNNRKRGSDNPRQNSNPNQINATNNRNNRIQNNNPRQNSNNNRINATNNRNNLNNRIQNNNQRQIRNNNRINSTNNRNNRNNRIQNNNPRQNSNPNRINPNNNRNNRIQNNNPRQNRNINRINRQNIQRSLSQINNSRRQDNNPNRHRLVRNHNSAIRLINLPESKIDKISPSLNPEKRSCPICLNDFIIGNTITILPCIHLFHSRCIKRWLRANDCCPICRTKITTSNLG